MKKRERKIGEGKGREDSKERWKVRKKVKIKENVRQWEGK